MKRLIFIGFMLLNIIAMTQSKEKALELSKDLFAEFKMNYDLSETIKALEVYPYDELVKELDTDSKKKAFWLNIYNVFGQIQLANHPDAYKYRVAFFRDKFIVIAGQKIHLNKIEHGMLRKSQWSYGFGYIPKPFPNKFEKELRIEEKDSRIHFALNCGAKSCPPIYVYEADKIDEQLDMAAAGFLEQESTYYKEEDVVETTRLMLWFKGDFGGKKGIYKMLYKCGVLSEGEKPKVKFKKYDWSLHLKNMKN